MIKKKSEALDLRGFFPHCLAQNGLVIQQVSESDHRATLLSLSDDGRGIYRRIVPRLLEEKRGILGRLSTAERAQLLAITDRRDGAFG